MIRLSDTTRYMDFLKEHGVQHVDGLVFPDPDVANLRDTCRLQARKILNKAKPDYLDLDWRCTHLTGEADVPIVTDDMLNRVPLASMAVAHISDAVGLGVFAIEDIPDKTFLGFYAGEAKRGFMPSAANANPYCCATPWGVGGEPYYIDAFIKGNVTRFFNAAEHNGVGTVKCVDVVYKDLLHHGFFAWGYSSSGTVMAGQQLCFFYGNTYRLNGMQPMHDYLLDTDTGNVRKRKGT